MNIKNFKFKTSKYLALHNSKLKDLEYFGIPLLVINREVLMCGRNVDRMRIIGVLLKCKCIFQSLKILNSRDIEKSYCMYRAFIDFAHY